MGKVLHKPRRGVFLHKRLASINPSCQKWHSVGRYGLQINSVEDAYAPTPYAQCSCTTHVQYCTVQLYMASARSPALEGEGLAAKATLTATEQPRLENRS
jgi:hypothetical protein